MVLALQRQLTNVALAVADLRGATRAERINLGERFVQCWAVSGRPVTQALDGNGQVWELHTVLDQSTKQVTEQYWTPLGMERRDGR
jgi:hypothetical protein